MTSHASEILQLTSKDRGDLLVSTAKTISNVVCDADRLTNAWREIDANEEGDDQCVLRSAAPTALHHPPCACDDTRASLRHLSGAEEKEKTHSRCRASLAQ